MQHFVIKCCILAFTNNIGTWGNYFIGKLKFFNLICLAISNLIQILFLKSLCFEAGLHCLSWKAEYRYYWMLSRICSTKEGSHSKNLQIFSQETPPANILEMMVLILASLFCFSRRIPSFILSAINSSKAWHILNPS